MSFEGRWLVKPNSMIVSEKSCQRAIPTTPPSAQTYNCEFTVEVQWELFTDLFYYKKSNWKLSTEEWIMDQWYVRLGNLWEIEVIWPIVFMPVENMLSSLIPHSTIRPITLQVKALEVCSTMNEGTSLLSIEFQTSTIFSEMFLPSLH